MYGLHVNLTRLGPGYGGGDGRSWFLDARVQQAALLSPHLSLLLEAVEQVADQPEQADDRCGGGDHAAYLSKNATIRGSYVLYVNE
jgi:hypothetical protein